MNVMSVNFEGDFLYLRMSDHFLNRIMSKYLFVLFFVVNCTTNKNPNDKQFKEEILGESFYSNGRLKIKVLKGRTPGEDTYLKIFHFDSLGNLSYEYGSNHYGRKYKSSYKYDLKGNLIEVSIYSFDTLNGQFENYLETYHDYRIQDTTANYTGFISSKILHTYMGDLDIQKTFELSSDSLIKKETFTLTSVDTFERGKNDR